ncbi:MAG: hypothetical protein PWQ88_1079 [Candidatus Methanomethylophilaceae archaeon]|nr:hypothetical protein [Candidatus Methanomethylophilaceae archaeon]HIJ00193.1 hypothetical protein [Candidatus Methanomethylophilaceae archaeon]
MYIIQFELDERYPAIIPINCGVKDLPSTVAMKSKTRVEIKKRLDAQSIKLTEIVISEIRK